MPLSDSYYGDPAVQDSSQCLSHLMWKNLTIHEKYVSGIINIYIYIVYAYIYMKSVFIICI